MDLSVSSDLGHPIPQIAIHTDTLTVFVHYIGEVVSRPTSYISNMLQYNQEKSVPPKTRRYSFF